VTTSETLDDRTRPRVGFVGLGSMGGPMARKVIESDLPTMLWARRPETLEPFRSFPVSFPASLQELGSLSTIVCICVVDDTDTREVVLGSGGVLTGMIPGGLLLIHSTIHPSTCVEIGEAARAHGVGVIDAPVSGGAPAAAAGRLAVMVGGEPEHVEQAMAVLRSYGDPIVRLGPLGSGQLAKLINNTLHAANLATADVALSIGVELGLDRPSLADLIAHSSGTSFGVGRLGQVSSLAEWSRISARLLRKDVMLLRRVFDQGGLEGDLLTAVAEAAVSRMGE
jgi:3-hydroxyisobutyrate dehydrogenase-like beta-hydroxyacid dehydrogenase